MASKEFMFDAAIFIVVVVFLVLHEYAVHSVSLLFEQGGRYGESRRRRRVRR